MEAGMMTMEMPGMMMMKVRGADEGWSGGESDDSAVGESGGNDDEGGRSHMVSAL